MSAEITIPRLGWSMEEGIFVRWLKRDGEWIKPGDQLFLLESEKATQEIEAIDEGQLHIIADAPQPGDTVKVGQVIAVLLAAGEAPPSAQASNAPQAAAPTTAQSVEAPAAGPAARRLARQLNVGLENIAGTGRGGKITAGDIHAEAARRGGGNGASEPVRPATNGNQTVRTSAAGSQLPSERPAIAPRARRAARELSIDLDNLAGTGRSGRIRERDVLAAAAQAGHAKRHAGKDRLAATSDATIKTGSIRRTIARRMVASHQTTAPVTLTTRADATNLVNVRQQFRAAAGPDNLVPSISDLVVKLLAIALGQHPRMNARWEEEQIVELAEIRVGLAVDTEAGLLVPVLPDVRFLGVRDIAAHSQELIAGASAGRLSMAELQGGTFTVTNLGMYGIDAFTPIINPPEAAILGLGAIRREPVFADADRVVPREMMTLSLTFDHRVVDGAPAARFLDTLRRGIENPAAWLTT